MANKKQRSTSGAGSKPAANAIATPPSASGTPGGPTPPSPSGAGARLAEHAGSVGASWSPAAPQRGDVRPDENAHAQTAAARPQHQANGAGSSAPKRPSSAAGDRQGGNGPDSSKHGTSQVREALFFLRDEQWAVRSDPLWQTIVVSGAPRRLHNVACSPTSGWLRPYSLLLLDTRCIL